MPLSTKATLAVLDQEVQKEETRLEGLRDRVINVCGRRGLHAEAVVAGCDGGRGRAEESCVPLFCTLFNRCVPTSVSAENALEVGAFPCVRLCIVKSCLDVLCKDSVQNLLWRSVSADFLLLGVCLCTGIALWQVSKCASYQVVVLWSAPDSNVRKCS